MTIRFSKTTGAFYPFDIDYGANLPADVVEVAKADFDAAMSRPAGYGFSFVAGVLTITPPAPPTLTQQIAAYEAAAQSALDAGAKAWGYDGIVSASSYAASTIPKFKAEALALIAWRDATWVAAETLLTAVQGGAAPPANPVAFVAVMPAQPMRPA
jgi:hypothetical protein